MRLSTLLLCVASAALALPASSQADHIKTTGTVSAQVTERRNSDLWIVEIHWTASCQGAAPGTAWYNGDLYMIDVDTAERIYVGGVVNTSGQQAISETREWSVESLPRSRRFIPELTIGCYENFPLHGGPDVVVTGNEVVIPPSFGTGGRGGGGNGGSGKRGSGQIDPTEPLVTGGCVKAVLGTNAVDILKGGDEGDVIVGFAAKDRLRGFAGHDCLIGGTGDDQLEGERGSDRLTGGGGLDVLIDKHGINAFDAGSGNDYVDARNRKRERVNCGPGFDRARVDPDDRVRSCELLNRTR
jgi:RTX calcium-binding nonapeptide repeat (4 copies)